ncbi:MAG TPA: iron-containing alcohol dehydrogenase [Alphaproteobacteria bacterium]|nr:iron-containing alcohol dehydrogenase [Alphaproteobacteria bacterium]
MIDQFFFQLNNRLHYGLGWSRKLGAFLQEKGYRAPALLVDAGVAERNPYYREIAGLVAAAGFAAPEILLRATEEPSYDYLDEVAARVRALPALDVIVAIGGGSALDTAKAVAALRTNPGSGIEYRGFDKIGIAPVDTICIPTTAGTGSEVTINAVFTDKREMRKLGINGRHMHATWAVLDAEWTASCPKSVAVSSGVDALVHTLESFTTTNSNPLVRAFNREAFRLLYENLPALVEEPGNAEKRQHLLLAAYLAAAGLFNSGSGIAGALSYPIGVHFKVPHGIGGGIFAASIVAYNVERGYHDYAELLDVVEPHPGWSAERKARRFVDALQALVDRLGVPRHLDQWGICRANLKEVATLMLPLQAAFNQNPVAFSAERDVPAILAKHVA